MDPSTPGRAEAADAARYRAALRLLTSPARMLAVERAVASLDMDGAPAAVCLTGRVRLRRARRIGLFAGSFNPLTLAHVALTDAAGRRASLDVVVWAIAAVTVDKEHVTRAALPERLAQLLAFARPRRDAVMLLNRGLYVDQSRILAALAAPGARIAIIIGYDKVVRIFDPRYYADRDAALLALFAAADLLVAPRADAGAAQLRALLARPENRPYAPHVAPLLVPPSHLYDSSTQARELAADPRANAAALARLLPPEAQALVATGAYRASGG